MLNTLSIDLEDYFMVSAFEGVVKREDWDRYESRIERNAHRLLGILNGSIRNPQSAVRNPVRATFFCLGWIAERYPGLIKSIKEDGHEIACHGYAHRLIYHQSMKASIGGREFLDAFYKVFSFNMRDLASPVHSRKLFAQILTHLNQYAKIGVVEYPNKPLAAGFSCCHRETVEIPWASSFWEYNPFASICCFIGLF